MIRPEGAIEPLEVSPGGDEVDVLREIYIFIIAGENNAVGVFFTGDKLKGAKVGIRRDAEVARSAAVHIEVPDQAEPSPLPEGCRQVAAVCTLPYPSLLIAHRNDFCVPCQVFLLHKAPMRDQARQY